MNKAMRKFKDYWVIFGFILIVFGVIGGCTTIDYKVFRNKYPNAGIGSYVWHKVSGSKR